MSIQATTSRSFCVSWIEAYQRCSADATGRCPPAAPVFRKMRGLYRAVTVQQIARFVAFMGALSQRHKRRHSVTTEPTPAPIINAQRHIHPALPNPEFARRSLSLHALPDNACAKQSQPAHHHLRHRLRFGRNAASITASTCPFLPALRRAWPGQNFVPDFRQGLLRPEFRILIDIQRTVEIKRGFNGSVIAIYLLLKIPAQLKANMRQRFVDIHHLRTKRLNWKPCLSQNA